MRYEVHPIAGPVVNRSDHIDLRTNYPVGNVAGRLERVYERVSAAGGKIIAGHTIETALVGSEEAEPSFVGAANYLFLVAEFPDR